MESVPDEMCRKWSFETNTFSGITHDELERFARIVAYKVAHNLRNGHPMDYTSDPLDYQNSDPHYEIIIWKTDKMSYPKLMLIKKSS